MNLSGIHAVSVRGLQFLVRIVTRDPVDSRWLLLLASRANQWDTAAQLHVAQLHLRNLKFHI